MGRAMGTPSFVCAKNRKNRGFLKKSQTTAIIWQKWTAFCGIIHYAQIHTLTPGWKGKFMIDLDAQFWEIFQQLSAEQKQIVAVSVLLSSLASSQESSAADLPSDSPYTS